MTHQARRPPPLRPPPLRPTLLRRPARCGQLAGSGLASLPVLLVLLLGATLLLLYLNRALVAEIRAAALSARSQFSFQAAEAGLQWTLAHLNLDRALDASCQPLAPATVASTAGSATSLRGLWLRRDPASGQWQGSGQVVVCRLDREARLACQCPGDPAQAPRLEAATGDTARIELRLTPLAGSAARFELESRACIGGQACSDAASRQRLGLVGLNGVVDRLPAALSALGVVRLSAGALVRHAQAEDGGLAVLGADRVDVLVPALALGPPGSLGNQAGSTGSAVPAVVAQDSGLAGLSADDFLASLLGIHPDRLANVPIFTRLACGTGACDAAELGTRLAEGARILLVDGDLTATAPVWGSPERPLLLLVRGRLSLQGPARLHGLVVARDGFTLLNNDADAAWLQGAAVVAGPVDLQGSFSLVYDGPTLRRVADLSRWQVAVPGSWRDFDD